MGAYRVRQGEMGGWGLQYRRILDDCWMWAATTGSGGVGEGLLAQLPASLRPDRGEMFWTTTMGCADALAWLEGRVVESSGFELLESRDAELS
jgi:hypothetical protein